MKFSTLTISVLQVGRQSSLKDTTETMQTDIAEFNDAEEKGRISAYCL